MVKAYQSSLNAIMEYFDLGRNVAFTIILITSVLLFTSTVFFLTSAPPTTLTIAAGPNGSIIHNHATKYAKALEKNGIKVTVLETEGSLDNLKRISDEKAKVDLAFVQSGSEDEKSRLQNLVSLGGMSYQPLFFFYRGKKIDHLTEMKGKKLAISVAGSGARKLSLKILKLHGISEGPELITMHGKDMSDALLEGKVDGAFLMGEDAPLEVLRKLLNSNDIQLMNFKNANAYARKIDVLHVLELPEGVLNFEKNIPSENLTLMGPMVELLATKDLHPALSDMILDTAMELQGNAGIFKKRGEFPMAVENKVKLSDDAERFYKSGKGFLYRYFPFWLASLLNRILFAFVPMLIILIPAVRSVPAIFRWLGHLRIRRRYRALLRIEEEFMREKDENRRKELYAKFEVIEKDVQRMKVKAIFAQHFYMLRSHIDYVRKRMNSGTSV